MATLKLGDSVLSIGRGTAVLNRMNKFVERGVRYAFNASLIDAVVRSSKTLDALYLKTIDQKDTGTQIEKLYENKISDNQKSYLRQLININVVDERERNRWESEIEDMTKDEASTAIQSFKK